MDHDTNTCTLRQWPASARGGDSGQARYDNWGGGGGGGGGGGELLSASDPIRKVGVL